MSKKVALFSCSMIGDIVNGYTPGGLTDKQEIELNKLLRLKNEPVGLTDKQRVELSTLEAKEDLTPAQSKKLKDLQLKLTTPKGLTDKQAEKLQELLKAKDSEPSLSQGAKTAIKDVWLKICKGFKPQITSKYLENGTLTEEDTLNLTSEVDGKMYMKNLNRVTIGNLTGECDVIHKEITEVTGTERELTVIDDQKSCFSDHTFMGAKMNPAYEWQGRGYMYLYGADKFRLRYCLVDTAPKVFEREYAKFRAVNGIRRVDLEGLKDYPEELLQQLDQCSISDDFPEFQFINQFWSNHHPAQRWDENGKLVYTKEERVKTFTLYRDMDKERFMLEALEFAANYFETITLNQID